MKTCTKCARKLPETEFYLRADGTLYSYCKRCVDRRRKTTLRALNAEIMPLVFELLTQHGPMQSASIIALVHQQRPDVRLTHQGLFAVITSWEHSSYIERLRDRRGLGYVYRVVGDTRPIFFEKSAMDKEHPPGVERVVDDPEGDAWFAALKAEVAERRAQRARMQW